MAIHIGIIIEKKSGKSKQFSIAVATIFGICKVNDV